MNNHRTSGFAALQKTLISLTTFGWFWLALYIWENVIEAPIIGLPWNYAFVAAVAVFMSTFGVADSYQQFLSRTPWQRFALAAKRANFQVAMIAFFVFAAYFATDIKETSRFFLGFFIGTSWPALVFMNMVVQ